MKTQTGEPKLVSFPAAIALIAFLVYVPFFFYLYSLTAVQALNRENPRFFLPVYGSDSEGYVEIADNILSHGAFSVSQTPPFAPDTFRTPGYPFLLAAWKWLFGSYAFFPILQFLLTLATALFLYAIGERLFTPQIGLIASVFYLLDPTTIFHTYILMSDVSYVFLLVAGVYALFFARSAAWWRTALLGGIIFGLSTLFRPISMYLIFAFLPFLAYFKRRVWSPKKIALALFVFLAAYAACVGPWVVRNKAVSGVWGISSVKDFNFFHYYIPEFLSYKMGITPDAARIMLKNEIGPAAGAPEVSLANAPLLRKVWTGYFYADPAGYIKFHLVKTIPFFLGSSVKMFFAAYDAIVRAPIFPVSNANLTNLLLHGQFRAFLADLKGSGLVTAEELFWLIVFFLMFVPLFAKERRAETALFLVLIFYFALLTGSVAYPRFRLPAAPFMFLLAVDGAFLVYFFAKERWFVPLSQRLPK